MCKSPIPPCFVGSCACEACRTNCEESTCCRRCGKIGCSRFHDNISPDGTDSSGRGCLMGFATVLSVIGTLFAILSCMGISDDLDTIKNFAWSYGEGQGPLDGFEIYIGLSGTVECPITGDCVYSDFDSGDIACSEKWCQDCKDASSDSIPTAIMGVITYLPSIATDLQRSTREGDINCQKFAGIFSGILGTVTTLSAVGTYVDACHNGLADNTVNIDWVLGPGLAFLFLSAAMKPFDAIFHLILPTPLEKQADDYDLLKVIEAENNLNKSSAL